MSKTAETSRTNRIILIIVLIVGIDYIVGFALPAYQTMTARALLSETMSTANVAANAVIQ
jgi:hypothetical protein